MELVLPNNYVVLEEEEMMYLEGEGWLANTLAVSGGLAGAIAGGIIGAASGAAIGTVTLPVIGTVSKAFILGTLGAANGFMAGYITGYNFGRILEKQLGWE